MNETDTLKHKIKEYEDAFHEILEQNNLCQFFFFFWMKTNGRQQKIIYMQLR